VLADGLRRGCLEDLAHHRRDLIPRCGVVRPQLGGQRGPAGLVQRPYLLIAQHKGDKLPAARIGEQADQARLPGHRRQKPRHHCPGQAANPAPDAPASR